MIEEFGLPKDIVDRQVQIGQTLKDDEFIGMVRREVLDDFLRQRAKTNGATLINGLFMGMTLPQSKEEPYVLTYNDFGEAEGSARSQAAEEEVVCRERAVCGDERGSDGWRK
ncbi:CHLP, partial [Symbiodinium sp. CCMP2456]